MPDPDHDGMVIGEVTITHVMTDDDTYASVRAVDGNGDGLPIAESLGLIVHGLLQLWDETRTPDEGEVDE